MTRVIPGHGHETASDHTRKTRDYEPHDLRGHQRDPAVGDRPGHIWPAYRVVRAGIARPLSRRCPLSLEISDGDYARVISSHTPPGASPDSSVMPLGADIVFRPERRRPGSPAIRQATGPTSSSACRRRFRTSVTSSESISPSRARLAIPRTRDEPCTGDCRTGDGVGPSRFSESRFGSEMRVTLAR